MEFILSASNNFVIGKDGDLVIRNDEDMRFFKQLTSEKCDSVWGIPNTLIMGSKTFFSIKKPLSTRAIIVITTKTVDEFVKECEENEIDMSNILGINTINIDKVRTGPNSDVSINSQYISLLNLDNFSNFYRLLLYFEMSRPGSRIFCIGGSDIYEQILAHDVFVGGYINRFNKDIPTTASAKIITDPCKGRFALYPTRTSDQFTRYVYFDSISVLNALSFVTKHIKQYTNYKDMTQCRKDIDFILGGDCEDVNLILSFYKIMYILNRISDSRSRKNDIDCYEQIMYSLVREHSPFSYTKILVEDFIDVKDDLSDFLSTITKYILENKSI